MKPHTEQSEPGILKDTAVAIGGAAGKVAALAKSVLPHHDSVASTATAAKKRIGKLAPKHKARLPRKEKKAMAGKAGAHKPVRHDM